MEKTMLAAAVSLALAGSVATAADIPGVIEGNPTYTQAKVRKRSRSKARIRAASTRRLGK